VFQKRRFPLLFLKASRNGFLKTLALLQECKLTKVIKVGKQYHFSLVEPRWPSEAYDHMIANGGLNVGAAGTPAKPQIDLAILAITRACGNGCEHCYERFNVNGKDTLPVSRWRTVIEELQSIGVSVVALSGGEPMLRFENTLSLLESADQRRSDFHLYTSGIGVRPERVSALVEAGLAGVAVGLDHYDQAIHDVVRGRAGSFDDAVEALRLFGDAGILTFVNTCITKELVASDGLWRFYDLLHRLGVGAIQLLEPKPCGGYAAEQIKSLYGFAEQKATMEFFEATSDSGNHTGYPAVYFPAFTEAPENLGCLMGGLSHLYIDSRGNVEPCVFLPVSFGNIASRSFVDIYRDMRRAVPHPLHKRCPALQLAERVGFDPGEGKELPLAFNAVQGEWQRMFA
jgi:MoaA/NifB/PqqE/SkfB family radical SAM enzyme